MLVLPDGRVSCELTLLPYNACAAAFTVEEYHAGLLQNEQCSEPHRACSCFSPTVWDDRYVGRLREAPRAFGLESCFVNRVPLFNG
jgi:hypothetical protein